ncbi:Atu2307/SP_0267 family LLM class monooxygenase [Flavobacterium silvaticum]|uniref:LLM class flavin-dependent oxidoreductase n=1 Tax=Flavobacterium silvaticum TaxID=1852020 RepID=A0A972FQK3_9FLAO|nr:Atu2307/SP_0267 family LLM class monooxygenase [Flavobacterium silvaticum]NMH26648.1 LLM class flavin-dependent oxidoreductase [Flavobacterium silvaticum]
MEIGIGLFGDLGLDASGKPESAHEKIRRLVEIIRLADETGLDVAGLGEHHREDYAVSVPEMVLAGAATVTQSIKLMSTVTVLSSSDPIRIYQNFSTLDALSNGRAEIGVGRGSFTESFPLFGYNLSDYETLFEENLELLLKINREKTVDWSGKLHPPLQNQSVFPRPDDGRELPVWIAVGGTPQSVQRAAVLGLPLVVAIIGGMPEQFKPLMDYYRKSYIAFGHTAPMQLGIHSHTFVQEDPKLIAAYFDNYASQMNRIGRDRGWSPYSREQYEGGRSADGALFIGNPEEVAEKIIRMKELFGLTRFIAHIDVGAPNHNQLMKTVELLGTKVAPLVRSAI